MNKDFFEATKYSEKDLTANDELKNFTAEKDSLTNVIGTDVDTIKIVKNFMPKKDVTLIMRKINDMYGIEPANNFYLDQANSKILEYTKKIKESAESFFNVELDYDDYASPSGKMDSYIAGRQKDFVTEVHTDNLDIDKEKYKEYGWSGHLSNLIYLNDNYDGGELYFPYHDLKIKPEPGMLISFPGNWWNRHGILPASDRRFAISIFFKIKDFK